MKSLEEELVSLGRLITPPFLWNYGCRPLGGIFGKQIRFVGNYNSWQEAKAASSGYEAKVILEKAITASLKVKKGEVAFERDGITFREMEYNFPLLWALMRATARHGRLHVLDFGGALGSSYFQLRQLVNCCPNLKWAVIEQPAHVLVGKKEFANSELEFYGTIEAACQENEYDILLLSSVIQYLPDPLGFLGNALKHRIPSIILDRTPFMVNGIARLTVQHVPEWIYPASYPAWFLSENEFLAKCVAHYERIATWPAMDKHNPEGGRAEYKGFLFELKKEPNHLHQ